MTSLQLKRLYFPAWSAAFKANWTWQAGRLSRHAPDTLWNVPVEEVAAGIAGMAVRAVTPDDLRHAVNALAIRRAKAHRFGVEEGRVPFELRRCSSADLNDKCDLSFGLFLAFCDLLTDDAALGNAERPGGALAWTRPEQIERAWKLRVIARRCVPGYVARVAREIYGESNPENLNGESLGNLYRTLGQRKNAWKSNSSSPGPRPVPGRSAPQPQEAMCEQPF